MNIFLLFIIKIFLINVKGLSKCNIFELHKLYNMETFFSNHAEELISKANLNKSEFSLQMGVARQNLNKVVIQSNNIQILLRAAEVLGVSLNVLIYGETAKENKSIMGFVEIDGIIHKINSKEDLLSLAERV